MSDATDTSDTPPATAMFVNIGERTNVTGSAKFKKLILNGEFDAAGVLGTGWVGGWVKAGSVVSAGGLPVGVAGASVAVAVLWGLSGA